MRGTEKLRIVELTTKPLVAALPELPLTETTLIRLIRVGSYGLEDYFQKIFRDIGLTEKSYHTLCVLVASKKRQSYPDELSELIGTSKANMTKILNILSKQDYVERESGKTDARRRLVKITPQGLAVVKQATPLVAGPVAEAFSGLSPEEMSALGGLLRKLIVSFDEAYYKADSIF